MRRIEGSERASVNGLNSIFRWLAPATVCALFIFAVFPRQSETAGNSLSTGTSITALDIVQIVSPEDYVVLTTVDGTYDNEVLSAGL